jgi:hypothetical protein
MQIVSERFFDALQAAVLKSSNKKTLDSPQAISTCSKVVRSAKKA